MTEEERRSALRQLKAEIRAHHDLPVDASSLPGERRKFDAASFEAFVKEHPIFSKMHLYCGHSDEE